MTGTKYPSSWQFAACALGMAVTAGLALAWAGMPWLSAVLTAIAFGCLASVAYAWWFSHRALRPVERVTAVLKGTIHRRRADHEA